MWKDIVTTPERKYLVIEVLRILKKVIPEENEDILDDQILVVANLEI